MRGYRITWTGTVADIPNATLTQFYSDLQTVYDFVSVGAPVIYNTVDGKVATVLFTSGEITLRLKAGRVRITATIEGQPTNWTALKNYVQTHFALGNALQIEDLTEL